uniref:Uncharacterized protein n=1 Tax=Spongospora subterranea TaxID=70186 RepID=A0A0H5QR60_9EUKA|eukprot:CRZ04565.1 hypothetical protein [Spongospora subterranea]
MDGNITAIECVNRLRSIAELMFLEDPAVQHPLTVQGSILSIKLDQARSLMAQLNQILTNKSTVSRLSSEKFKFSHQLQSLNQTIDESVKLLTNQREIDNARREGYGQLYETIQAIQRICQEVGGLSCDTEITQQKRRIADLSNPLSDSSRNCTIIIGSEGESACFALEIALSMMSKSPQFVVDSIGTTFQFGEVEWASESVDNDIRHLLENMKFDEFKEKLSRVIRMESVINTNPDTDLHNIRDRARQVFEQMVPGGTIDLFEGPCATYMTVPYDLVNPAHSSPEYKIVLVSASVGQESKPSHYYLELIPPISMSWTTAAASYGCPNTSEPKPDPCSFAQLLVQHNTSPVPEDSARLSKTFSFSALNSTFSCMVSPDVLYERGVLVSNLCLQGDLTDSLTGVIPFLQQQAMFNTLFESCCHNNADDDMRQPASPEIHLKILSASSSEYSLTMLARKAGEPEIQFTVTIGRGSAISVEFSQVLNVCTTELASLMLSRCLSIPILVYYIYNRSGVKSDFIT